MSSLCLPEETSHSVVAASFPLSFISTANNKIKREKTVQMADNDRLFYNYYEELKGSVIDAMILRASSMKGGPACAEVSVTLRAKVLRASPYFITPKASLLGGDATFPLIKQGNFRSCCAAKLQLYIMRLSVCLRGSRLNFRALLIFFCFCCVCG